MKVGWKYLHFNTGHDFRYAARVGPLTWWGFLLPFATTGMHNYRGITVEVGKCQHGMSWQFRADWRLLGRKNHSFFVVWRVEGVSSNEPARGLKRFRRWDEQKVAEYNYRSHWPWVDDKRVFLYAGPAGEADAWYRGFGLKAVKNEHAEFGPKMRQGKLTLSAHVGGHTAAFVMRLTDPVATEALPGRLREQLARQASAVSDDPYQ